MLLGLSSQFRTRQGINSKQHFESVQKQNYITISINIFINIFFFFFGDRRLSKEKLFEYDEENKKKNLISLQKMRRCDLQVLLKLLLYFSL